MNRLATAALILLATASACDPCEIKIVQLSTNLGKVRVSNDCPVPLDMSDKMLCSGQGGKYEKCVPLAGEAPIEAGACVDIAVNLGKISTPEAAAAVAVFRNGQDKVAEAPLDAVAWGFAPLYKGDGGSKMSPEVTALTVAKSLTRGHEGWYNVDSGPVMTACATWGHIIEPGKRVCLPRLVEVHPGPNSFLKIAMPEGCPDQDLSEFHLAWGTDGLHQAVALPAKSLAGGECLTVGGPESTWENGWAQWDWDMLEPVDFNEIELIEDGSSGLASMAALLWGGEANNGVIWGGSLGQIKTWPNLDSVMTVVPGGRSLRWDGSTWAIQPMSANQCPRWTFTE